MRCWGIRERPTNQQQKAKLEKKMYNTLFVRPNIAKPMLHAVLLLRTEKYLGLRLADPQLRDQTFSCQAEFLMKMSPKKLHATFQGFAMLGHSLNVRPTNNKCLFLKNKCTILCSSSPNIAKPVLHAVLLLRTESIYGFACLTHN